MLAQKTPERVAHRRADKTRERWIELQALQAGEQPGEWSVDLVTQHGTYVKEFISGEERQDEAVPRRLAGWSRLRVPVARCFGHPGRGRQYSRKLPEATARKPP